MKGRYREKQRCTVRGNQGMVRGPLLAISLQEENRRKLTSRLLRTEGHLFKYCLKPGPSG